MTRSYKISTLLIVCLMLVGSMFTSCDDDDLSTNQYSSGVTLNAFGPCPILRGNDLTIVGGHLKRVDAVKFPGNVYANAFVSQTDDEIIVTVPQEALAGQIALISGKDTISSVSSIAYDEPVTVNSISPTVGLSAGDLITITGDYVNNIEAVIFQRNVMVKSDDFVSVTRTEVKLRVPKNAVSGIITLLIGTNSEERPEVLEIASASYSSISATESDFGEQLVIIGENLNLVESVTYPGLVDDATFVISTDGTQITTTIPVETKSGVLTLNLYSGMSLVTDDVTLPAIAATAITPVKELAIGDIVTITGINLDRVKKIVLPGDITLEKEAFDSQTTTTITFAVPEDMGDGKVTLVQNANISVETAKIAMHHDGAEKVIWSGSVSLGTTWLAAMSALSWNNYDSDFRSFKEGMEMYIYVEYVGPDWGCIIVGDGTNWNNISEQMNLEATDVEQRFVFKPTKEQITTMQTKNGIVIKGYGAIVKKVSLSIPQVIAWSGSIELKEWGGFSELAYGNYDWSTLTEGSTLYFDVEMLPTATSGCFFVAQGDEWLKLSEQINLDASVTGVQRLSFVPSADNIAALQNKNGMIIQGNNIVLKQIVIQ